MIAIYSDGTRLMMTYQNMHILWIITVPTMISQPETGSLFSCKFSSYALFSRAAAM